MDHPFTIESSEAFALASELAALTGESLTDAVMAALRERLARERELAEKFAKVQAITADIRAHMKHPLPTSDMSDWYDENGLPI